MFLAIDAGNSNVVFALFDSKSGTWTNQFRLETKNGILRCSTLTSDALCSSQRKIEKGILCGTGIAMILQGLYLGTLFILFRVVACAESTQEKVFGMIRCTTNTLDIVVAFLIFVIGKL